MESWKQIRYIYRGCSAGEHEHFLLIGMQGISLLSFITRGRVQQPLGELPGLFFPPFKSIIIFSWRKSQELLLETLWSTRGLKESLE